MRWLSVDPGTRRVGIAACDEHERVAVPVEVVPTAAAFPAIRSIARRERAGGVVVGLPLLLSGSEGEAARMARRLGERIERALGLPVQYEDERLSSAAVARGGRGGKPQDDVVAALILQQFLDRRRNEARREANHGPARA